MKINPDRFLFTVLLGLFAGLPALSIDISAPTLALLPAALDTPSVVAGLSLSLFMVGFAGGQFAGGRLSDRSGRRPILLIALFVYTISGICCAIATSGGQLATARLLQGVGAGGCSVQAYAIVQDLFLGEEARRKQSYVSIVLTITPMLAPALGALLVERAGWRSVHVVLAIGGVVLGLAVAVLLAESRPAAARVLRKGLGLRDGLAMLRERLFGRIALVNALSYGTIFAYIAGAPMVVMNQLHYPPLVYAGVFAASVLSLSAGAITSARLGPRGYSAAALIWPALMMQAGSTLVMALSAGQVASGGLWLIVPALFASSYARGLASPNLVHLAISGHRENAGLASAMVGLTQLLVGALSSAFVAAVLPYAGYAGVAVTMATLSFAAVAVWAMSMRVPPSGPAPMKV